MALTWNGESAIKAADEAVWQRLLRAAQVFTDACLEAVNVPNTGVRVKRRHGRGSYTIYPNPSKSGEPPRKRTGWGQRHIKQVRDRALMRIRVGVTVNAKYMAFLEKGTRRIKPRPWLSAMLDKHKDKLGNAALRNA